LPLLCSSCRCPIARASRRSTNCSRAAPDVPILILGGSAEEALAKQAVGRGAQDYLLPGRLDSYSLPRALRNAIERKAVEDALFVEKERAQVTLNSIGDAVLCTDISGNITYLNLVAETMDRLEPRRSHWPAPWPKSFKL